MGKKIKLTRQELIDIYTDVEKERRADPGRLHAALAFAETKVVEIVARHDAEDFLRRLRKIREQQMTD